MHSWYFSTRLLAMNNESMLTVMKRRVSAARGRWPAIAAEADLEYQWLSKVMQGRITDPGVIKVERILAAIDRLEGPRRMISRSELVIAILDDLDRQVPGFAADQEFYNLVLRVADHIANAANALSDQDQAA